MLTNKFRGDYKLTKFTVSHNEKDPETMTRIEFISFLKDFKTDFEQNKSKWENKTLEDFLDSMISYTEDIQGYYDNMKMNINADDPSWENFMNILKGASMYE